MSQTISFADMGLSATTLEAIASKGFSEPSPIQAATIPILLNQEQDIIGQAQTGTGKTAAFGIPLIEQLEPGMSHPQAIVLAPTRELAIQVAQEIESFVGNRKHRITCVYGGSDISRQIKALRKGVDIVVGTPGRVQDLMKRKELKLHEITHVVLDEADEMLNMGFIDDVRNILSATPSHKRVVLFSATMPKAIQKLAEEFMTDYELVKVNRTKTTSLTRQIYFEVRVQDKLPALERIIDMAPSFYGIVFCRTRRDVDQISNELVERGYRADGLHGEINQHAREQILGRFRNRSLSILVATDVAARGIDVNDLTHVVNVSVPQDSETYTHRIGRTGRAGKEGLAITLVNPGDRQLFNRINRAVDQVIKQETLPTGKDMVEIKRQSIIHQLVDRAENAGDKIDPMVALIADQLPIEKAMSALLQLHYGRDLDASKYLDINAPIKRRDGNDSGPRDRNRNERRGSKGGNDRGGKRPVQSGDQVRLFIKKGKMDGMGTVDLIRFLERKTGVFGRDINGVKVLKSFSFVTVKEKDAKKILSAFKQNGSKGRPLVEVASD